MKDQGPCRSAGASIGDAQGSLMRLTIILDECGHQPIISHQKHVKHEIPHVEERSPTW